MTTTLSAKLFFVNSALSKGVDCAAAACCSTDRSQVSEVWVNKDSRRVTATSERDGGSREVRMGMGMDDVAANTQLTKYWSGSGGLDLLRALTDIISDEV